MVVTEAQRVMLEEIRDAGYVHGSRGALATPRLEAKGLIERVPGSGLHRLTQEGVDALAWFVAMGAS